MDDLLKREPKDYDLVVKSFPNTSVGGYNVHLAFGIIKGNSIYYKKYMGVCGEKHKLSRCRIMNYFIVSNPTKEEMKMKKDLIERLDK